MTIETQAELDALRRVGAVVARARDLMLAAVQPGVTTAELDAIGRAVLEEAGARSAPRLAYRFPAWTCISVNDELAHGIPCVRRSLRAGDLVNVDVSAELDGWWADTGASIGVGDIRPQLQHLLRSTQAAQQAGMDAARAGEPLRLIGRAVERHARRSGYRVVADLCGHGIGRHIHEQPDVANIEDPRERRRLKEGMVLTVEPFLTPGRGDLVTAADGWTLRTRDGAPGAQFEHTFVVTRGAPIVLTLGDLAA
jgi:methionyl aminopeptidase